MQWTTTDSEIRKIWIQTYILPLTGLGNLTKILNISSNVYWQSTKDWTRSYNAVNKAVVEIHCGWNCSGHVRAGLGELPDRERRTSGPGPHSTLRGYEGSFHFISLESSRLNRVSHKVLWGFSISYRDLEQSIRELITSNIWILIISISFQGLRNPPHLFMTSFLFLSLPHLL